MKDCAVKMDKNQLKILQQLYKQKNETKYFISQMAIDNFIKWYDQDPNVDYVHFFCLNGDISDGTFIVIVSKKISINIFFAIQFICFKSVRQFSSFSFSSYCFHFLNSV